MSKILIVTARRYNGHELWTFIDTLLKRGHSCEVLSTGTLIQDEKTSKKTIINHTLDEFMHTSDITGIDALSIISGHTDDVKDYWNNPLLLSLIDTCFVGDKVVGAICRAVPTLRYITTGKVVSTFPLIICEQLLRDNGAIISGASLSVDGKIVTAENDLMAEMWSTNFCDVLEDKQPTYNLIKSPLAPKGRERKPIPVLEQLKERNASNKGTSQELSG